MSHEDRLSAVLSAAIEDNKDAISELSGESNEKEKLLGIDSGKRADNEQRKVSKDASQNNLVNRYPKETTL